MTTARDFAIFAHGDQTYNNGPYVLHLDAVVGVLRDFKFGQPYLDAGWLHDVVEDTDVALAEIDRRFGPDVAGMVDAVSGLGATREARNARIYTGLRVCPAAAAVKLADRIANVEAAAPGSTHSKRYLREADAFADAVTPHVPAAMWARLERALEKASG